MRDNIVYEQYSSSGDYKYEVCRRKDGTFEVYVEKKYTDSDGYMPEDWFQYLPVPDTFHLTDTLQTAIEIGEECLRNLE